MSREIPIRPQILIASLTDSLKGAARVRRVARLTREREEREAARQRWNAWWAEFLQELRLSESDPPQTMAPRTHDILAWAARPPVADRARIEALLRQRHLTELELSARYWSIGRTRRRKILPALASATRGEN
jgi:hypothetical protein